MNAIIDIAPVFKKGDPAPAGYCEWQEWASVQHRAGLRQKLCRACQRWLFPQEICGCGTRLGGGSADDGDAALRDEGGPATCDRDKERTE